MKVDRRRVQSCAKADPAAERSKVEGREEKIRWAKIDLVVVTANGRRLR